MNDDAQGSPDESQRELGTAELPLRLRLDERYEIKERISGTRTADSFEAIDKSTGAECVVWQLRSPLAAGSEAAGRFVKRINAIQGSNAEIPHCLTFGVDPANKAYLVTEKLSGRTPISLAGAPSAQLEQVFRDMTLAVASCHEVGVVLGDIGEESFIVTPEGRVVLVGLLGSFEIEAVGTTMLPAAQTLHFLSPEQRSGSGLEPASDVFALGIYGYRLFAGRYPRAEKHMPLVGEDIISMVPQPSGVRRDLTGWIDDVIGKCVEPQIEARFSDARELSHTVAEAIRTGVSPAGPSRWSRKTVMIRPNTMGVIRDTFGQQSKDPAVRAETAPALTEESVVRVGTGWGLFIASTMLMVMVLIGGGAFLMLKKQGTPTADLESEVAIHDLYAPPELKRSMHDMVAPGLTLAERKIALGKIAEHDDPVAYAVLISAVKGAPGPELRLAAQQYVVERIRRQGLERSAGVVERWFTTLAGAGKDPSKSAGYTHLLRACDRSLPLDARRFALNKAYAAEPSVGLELAAALALDDSDENNFVPVLRQVIADSIGNQTNLEGKSAAALVIGHRTLSLIFDKDLAAHLPKLSAQDLAWTLLRLSESESNLLYDVADETLKRKVVPPFQVVFLKVLLEADRLEIPSAVKRALVRAARGEIDESDVVAFGRWTSLGAEQALLAVCAIASKQEVAMSAFETLAARGLDGEPARSVVTWIKNSYWDYRDKLVKAVGILGLSDTATSEQIEYAFDVLMPFTNGGQLLKVVMNSGNDDLISRALERLGEATSSEDLTPLLSHENKSIRIAAVNALKGRNELNVLQSVVRAYEKEKDPEVQEVYRQVHWVTRDREKGIK